MSEVAVKKRGWGGGKRWVVCKSGRRKGKVWGVIRENVAAILSRRAPVERDAHRSHRLYGRGFHAKGAHTPFTQRVRERGAGRRLGRNHLVPHRSGLGLEHRTPLPRQRVGVERAVSVEQLRASHVWRDLQVLRSLTPDKADALAAHPT